MNFEEIINLPVYTQSGYYLGRVAKIEIDPRTDRPSKYIVKSRNFIKNLFRGALVIEERQVISITKEKMVVEDTLKRVEETAPLPAN